jgi:hypothetical protein
VPRSSPLTWSMAGDASANHIHVSQNAADGASPLNCSPACPQQPPPQDGADYEDDYGGGEIQNGAAGHVASPPKSSNGQNGPKQSPPKGNKNPASGNKKSSSSAANAIPRTTQSKPSQSSKQAGHNGKQGGKPTGGNSGKPSGGNASKPTGGNSNKIANNNEVKANACPGRQKFSAISCEKKRLFIFLLLSKFLSKTKTECKIALCFTFSTF